MNRTGYTVAALLAMAGIWIAGYAPPAGAGVPEPAITLYGKVFNEADALVTSGVLDLTWRPPLGGDALQFSVSLSAVVADGGPYSYQIELPCERPMGGMNPTPDTLQLSTTAIDYTRTAKVENLSAEVLGEATVSLSTEDRGMVERLDFRVEGLVVDAPPAPTGPNPPDGQLSVPISIGLSWDSDPSVTRYDLYFWKKGGAVPATPLAADLLTNQYLFPNNLDYSTTYRWQVVAHNAVDQTPGAVWTFSTLDEISGEGEGSQEFTWGDIGGTGTGGEVSCNDAPGGQDASLILQWYAGLIDTLYACPGQTPYVAPAYPPGADVNGDGLLGGQDASEILRYFAGIIDCFPADGNCDDVGPAKAAKAAEYARLITMPIGMELPAPGSPLIVPVQLDAAEAVRSYRIEVRYPADQLTLTSVAPGELAQAWGAPTINPLPGGVLVVNAGMQPLQGAGELLYLTFEVNPFATGGRLLFGARTELNDQHIPVQLEAGDFGKISHIRLTRHPVSGMVETGIRHVLSVAVADAFGAVHYQWKHDGQFVGEDAAQLVIDETTEADSGHYYCVVTDDLDSIESKEAELRVAEEMPLSRGLLALAALLLGLSGARILARRTSSRSAR